MFRQLFAWLLFTHSIWGSVVVLDRNSGRILYREGSIEGRSSPGSLIKPFVLQALLKDAASSPPVLSCPGTLTVAGRGFDCMHGEIGHPLNSTEALAYSCNNWFASSVIRLRPDALAAQLLRAGFGAVAPATSPDQLRLQALGEFGISTSPLEVARAYRRLAGEANPKVEAGMAAAIEYGTARLASVGGLQVYGKTGTTNHQAWFAGYSPEVVVVVRIASGSGGADAAPVAAQYFKRFGGKPSLLQVQVGDKRVAMSMEEYVAFALSGEASSFQSIESLKAMAVVIRSYARQNVGRHKGQGFDFCDTTHCQRLVVKEPRPLVRAAVEATEAETLWYQGSPAMVFYHQHCGGTTEAAGNIWPQAARPYLRSVSDTYCVSATSASWQSQISRTDLAKVIGPDSQGTLDIKRRAPSGRVQSLQAGTRQLTSEQFHIMVGRALGWNLLKSAWYTVQPSANGFQFTGKGGGHGVGLCQTGAAVRGERGQDYLQIVQAYFPGTAVGVTAQGIEWLRRDGARTDVMVTGAQAEEQIPELADHALDEAERRSGLHSSRRARVLVYPTVQQFVDSTGEPAWIAAHTTGATVRLQPAAVLLRSGSLRSVFLHEMVHVVLNDNRRAALPDWFEEGLALVLSGSAPPAHSRLGYLQAQQRVATLIERHGREQVIGWIRTGLPK